MSRKIYLDNAATSFPKPDCVIEKLNFCLKKYCGNPGRSSHSLSVQSAEAIYSAREKIAKMLSTDSPERVVFLYNATHALNLAIKTLITEKCHVLISDFEHNSVIRPLYSLKRKIGIEYSTFNTDGDLITSLRDALRPDTKAIVSSIASNVTGRSISLPVLSEFARNNSLYLIIDASQAIGHCDINLSKNYCNALCAPGHKGLFGIQGSGFVCFNEDTRRDSFFEGGSGFDSASLEMPILLPEGYEAGTLATPAIVSLAEGIDYISKIGLNEINNKLSYLTMETEERLSQFDQIKILGKGNGIVSFNLGNLPSSIVAEQLDDLGICVRGGLHCAPSIHRKLGTINRGAVRISYSYLNDLSDVDGVYKAIRTIISEM